MTKLSPTEAAKQWKIGKSTIYRAFEKGELSYDQDDSGRKLIDVSEMVRFFGEPKKVKDELEGDSESSMVKMLREMMERQEKAHTDHIKSLEKQLDFQKEQNATILESQADTTKLLLHLQDSIEKGKPEEASQPVEVEAVVEEPTTIPEPVQQPAKRKKSLFQRVLSAVVED